MEIINYIKKCLARYGRVEIVGSGVLTTEYVHASVNGDYILPPREIVIFTEGECRSNGFLERMIMDEHGVGFYEAQDIIRREMIGIDLVAAMGDCRFLPANYGYKILRLPEMKHQRIDMWRYAAAAVVACMVNLAVPFGPKTTTINEASLGIDLMREVVVEQPRIELEPDEVVERHYCVIVSSLDTEEKAMNYIMKNGGELVVKDNHYRVVRERFAGFAEAQQYIKDNGLNAWVYCDL